MSQFSQIIDSFERTGNFPLESDYIFGSEEELLKYYQDPVKQATMHAGLFRIVDNKETNKQDLYWVEDRSGVLTWVKFSGASLGEDVTVIGVTVGNFTPGTVIKNGTTFTDFVKQMVTKPSKGYLSLLVNGNIQNSATLEIGTPINNVIARYTQNQSGNLVALKNVNITAGYTDKSALTVGAIQGTNVTISVTARVSSGTNTIVATANVAASSFFAAGDLAQSSNTINGVRKYFFGQGTAPTASADIRNGTSILAAGSYSYALAAGNTAMWVAIPDNKTITEVKDAGALNAVITSSFVKSGTVNVDGATTGKDATSYSIYQLSGYGPFGSAHTMNIKFS